MKVTILNSTVPFVYGGAEILAENLYDKLEEYGHSVHMLKVPFAITQLQHITKNMIAAKFTKIENTEKLIVIKFPGYYVEHDNKVFWLLHQFRQAYDLLDSEYKCFGDDEESKAIKQAIYDADKESFSKGNVYTISDVVSQRLLDYNNIESKVLYPPLFKDSMFYNTSCGDYLYYPSRVNGIKRQHLAVEAMRYVKSDVKLILTGKGDLPRDEDHIFSEIEKYNLKSKVKYINNYISEQAKLDYYANCLGVLFIPHNEDYGYITIEGLHCEKPIITCNDSGGACLFVEDKSSGFITNPDPHELAEAMDSLYVNKARAKEMGKNAHNILKKKNINWDNVISSLIG